MTKYTITSDYYATGEGRTLSIVYCFAQDEAAALEQFKKTVYGGDWYVLGATVIEGFDFDNEVARYLITAAVKAQLLDERCNLAFSSQLHFNYS
jgi:proline racemase